jgi:hypothetical protein
MPSVSPRKGQFYLRMRFMSTDFVVATLSLYLSTNVAVEYD